MRFIIGDGKVSKIIRRSGDVILSHKDIEITDVESVRMALVLRDASRGSVVINTAAKIDLEWCEENKLDAYRVNTLGAINIAKVCNDIGAKLVHISSGCVFDGNSRPMNENDVPSPAAWYTRTKVWADEAISNILSDHLILRPRQLISAVPAATNMLTKFLAKKNIRCIDESNSITSIEDLQRMVDYLISERCRGIFNCASEGTISPYDVACALRDKVDSSMVVSKVDYGEYVKTLKVRRVNTILDLTKLKKTGYVPRSARETLDWCVENYGKARTW